MLIEEADGVEVRRPEQCRSPAPREHLAALLVLVGVALGEPAVAGETHAVELRADVVDHVELGLADLDLNPGGLPLAVLTDSGGDGVDVGSQRHIVGLFGRQSERDPSGRAGTGDQAELGPVPGPPGELLVAGPVGVDRAVEALIEAESIVVACLIDPDR